MSLSKRLHALADIIPACNRIIDVGCDHALLDIYLIKSNKIKKALAIDIHEKALNFARKNISNARLEDKIEVILNDGLNRISILPNDVVVIAGMGRKNIIKILENKLSNINNLIIQSNNEHYALRKWLHKQGYIITREVFITEHHKEYIIISFIKGYEHYHYLDYWLGPKLKDDQIYLEHLKKYYHQLLKDVPKQYFIRRYQIKRRTSLLEKKCRSSHVIRCC